MGGADSILRKGHSLYEAGEFRNAMEIVNKLVCAEPQSKRAKSVLADVFEQLGYQYESAGLRNSFLSAARELRNGIRPTLGLETGGPGGIKFKLNFVTPDNGEKLVVEMSNGTLTNIVVFTASDADATLTINRADLVPVMMQQATLATQLQAGKAKLSGNALVLAPHGSTLVAFDPLFEMMPGTR